MQDPGEADRSEFLTLQGRGTSPGLACGPLLRNRPQVPPDDVRGSILLAEHAVPDDLGRIMASAGTVTLGGAMLSHVSLLSREFGKPSVSLATGDRAWLLPEGAPGLLDLSETAGTAPAVIDEGDIVLLDGDRGTLRIPGVHDMDSRRSVRRLHSLLLEFARHPEDGPVLREIVESARDPLGPQIPFLLEAGLVYRLVPEGLPARLLLDVLSSGASRPALLEPRLVLLRARILASATGRHDKALEALRMSADPNEVERIVCGFESFVRRAQGLLLDLGMDPADLERLRDDVEREAADRLDGLRIGLRRDVAAALEIPDDRLEELAGSLYVLVRRAHSAGLDDASVSLLRKRLDHGIGREEADAHAPLVARLEGTLGHDRSLVGGKAAGILEVRHLLPPGCRIPRGFVVTSAAYRLHVRGEIGEHLKKSLREGEDEAQVSRRARAALLSGEIPGEVVRAVGSSLRGLVCARLAVRSSATVEDGPAGSLAGQFDTYLGVRGLPELLNRIRWAWASLWNARAVRTLSAVGLSPLDASQAVIVQEMIETRSAGVLVSRDAARGADTLLVNAAWGLGEGISQGGIAGDLFWVRRSTGELLASEAGASAKQIVLDPGGTGTVESLLPPDKAGRLCLNGGQLARLAALARALEGAGRAVRDVEFGFAGDDSLIMFQVRPVVPGSADRSGRV